MIIARANVQATQWCPWCGDHMGWGGGGFAMLFWVLLLVFLVGVAAWALSRRDRWGGGTGENRASEILRERYARGDIDEESYRRMREELRR